MSLQNLTERPYVPSRTAENYLKAIYQAQLPLVGDDALVPMGQLAATLGVVPGTATTMVKTLAESGLAQYEPYVGVRLTVAGERLAANVLRRHRLVELFLVQVMGMSWTEVHEDAEQLEHVVSDRLIDRMDEMLGHPVVDPHGDPIPGPGGIVSHADYHSLLTCPLHRSAVVTRVMDQDADFLRFIESSELMPGQSIEIEARDEAADSVRVRRQDDRRITIGMRAASKVLVQVLQVALLVGLAAGAAHSQTPPSAAAPAMVPFAITDNSFLVEEAFNQETGIFQNIFGVARSKDGWAANFTQEWPVVKQAHQFSYSVPFSSQGGLRGVGDVLLNYRYQVLLEGPGRPAFAPRFSLVVPSGSEDEGRGSGVVGYQVNLPFSKQAGDLYFHWNGGVTVLPRVNTIGDARTLMRVANDKETLVSPFLAGSVIARIQPMFHLMLESVLSFDDRVLGLGLTDRLRSVIVSPGFRGGWNVGDAQIVLGAAVPITRTDGDTSAAAFGYFSYELPFRKQP